MMVLSTFRMKPDRLKGKIAAPHLSPLLELDGRFCGAMPEKEEAAIRGTPGRVALVAAGGGGTFSLARSSHPNEEMA